MAERRDDEDLARSFQEHRTHLRALAYRMLGSVHEADDVVQDAWLRLSRVDPTEIENLGGWLTTVVSRLCLDVLRTRKTHREVDLATPGTEAMADRSATVAPGPEEQVLLADSLGPALVTVLDTLTPVERLAFVLHDLFGMPFDEIAPVVGRSTMATRQLASRARRRVRGAGPEGEVDAVRRREVVSAFFAASRDGDFTALLALLDPEVELRADATAVAMGGAEPSVTGADVVARTFSGRARAAREAEIDGEPGAVWAYRGEIKIIFALTVENGLVTAIDLLGDPETLAAADVVFA